MTLTGVLTRMVTGPTPMTDGHGFRMKISVGQLITTVVGPGWLITAGFGSLATTSIGARRGFPGEPAVTMSAGRLYRRAARALSMGDSPSALVLTSSSTSVPNITTLST